VKCPGAAHNPGPVHCRHPGPPSFRRVELGQQRVRLPALPAEVVGRRPRLAWLVGRDTGRLVVLGRERHQCVEDAQPIDKSGVAQRQVVEHHSTEVTTHDAAPLVAEHVVDERVHVDRHRGHVGEPVGGHVGVAVAAQVGRDHLEAGRGERADVSPPNPLRLRITVDQQQWEAARALAYESEADAGTHLAAFDGERVRVRRCHKRESCR
jgi:hypothetical protein